MDNTRAYRELTFFGLCGLQLSDVHHRFVLPYDHTYKGRLLHNGAKLVIANQVYPHQRSRISCITCNSVVEVKHPYSDHPLKDTPIS